MLLAGLVLAGSIFLFPTWADASFAVNDPLWFAHAAEHDPWNGVMGHHPLYHVLVAGAAAPLRAAGVAQPADVACKVVSGFGAAAIVLLLGLAAGPRRRTLGLLCVLPLLASRGFILEAATGENVLPACAAALGTLLLACRRTPHLGAVGAALVLSLLLRQDNLLIVPGVALALALGRPRGDRLKPITLMIAASGVATLAGYALLWWIGAPDGQSLHAWMLKLALDDDGNLTPWGGPRGFVFGAHFATLGTAVTGLCREDLTLHLVIGGAFAGLLLFAAAAARGTRPCGRFALAAAVVVGLRIPFFAWFEPINWEWWLLPMILVTALGVSATGGEPRTPAWIRRAVGVLVLGATIAILWAHGPRTWELRERRMIEAARSAIELGGTPCDFVAYGFRARTAFHVLQVPAFPIPQPQPAEAMIQWAMKRMGGGPHPMVILMDRFVGAGMPIELLSGSDGVFRYVDALEKPPYRAIMLRREGRVEAIGWHVGKFRAGD